MIVVTSIMSIESIRISEQRKEATDWMRRFDVVGTMTPAKFRYLINEKQNHKMINKQTWRRDARRVDALAKYGEGTYDLGKVLEIIS